MFKSGQDVLVTFDGVEYPGEVLEHRHGRVMARISVDPLTDHGELTAMLGIRSIVSVVESDVRVADD